MKKLLATALIALLSTTGPNSAQAQVVGSVVYDPANYKNATLRYAQLIAQLRQLRATYAQVLNHYNLAVQMSHSIPNMVSRYGTSSTPWRYANARDLYGNTTPWLNGANSGLVPAVLNGYQKATSTLQSYSQTLLSLMPQSEVQRLEADAATVELVDGAAQNALAAIGAIRANAVSTTSTIRNIQSDSLSSNANLNTEVGVLNKVNATSVLSLQSAQDTNKLLVALLEQQTILSKQLRDASTNITNADISRRQNTVAFRQQLTGNIGQTLNGYRLP